MVKADRREGKKPTRVHQAGLLAMATETVFVPGGATGSLVVDREAIFGSELLVSLVEEVAVNGRLESWWVLDLWCSVSPSRPEKREHGSVVAAPAYKPHDSSK